MIKPLPNPLFSETILEYIDRARHSVLVVNYLAEIQPAPKAGVSDVVRAIAMALIRATKRGVRVEVLLEGMKFGNNYAFYRLLKDAGVDVWMDTSMTFIHYKVVLIDGTYIAVGSHNLTMAALTSHEEYSVITDDKGVVKNFKEEITVVTRQRETIRGRSEGGAVMFPASFFKETVGPMFHDSAEDAFDLYMFFCREDGGRPRKMAIDEEAWCRHLGIDRSQAGSGVTKEYLKGYYRKRVDRIIQQLLQRDLIVLDRKNRTIKRKKIKKDKDGRIIKIGNSYWDFGWQGRLSFAAKFFYLISLMETCESPYYPWWSYSLKEIAKRHNCDAVGLGGAARELSDYNLIEVLRGRSVIRSGHYQEEAQYYRTNPFYDMAGLEKELALLEKKYSRRTVLLSRKVAALFWDSHDIDMLEAICALTRIHGLRRVVKVSRSIVAAPKSSAKHTLEYLINSLS